MSLEDFDIVYKRINSLIDTFYADKSNSNEFFNAQNELIAFQNNPQSWKYCIQFLACSPSIYLGLYSLNIISDLTKPTWYLIGEEYKSLIKKSLENLIISRSRFLDSENEVILISKAAKILASIAKFDWPHSYSDYFDNIFCLFRESSSINSGLITLKISLEELIRNDVNFSSARTAELKEKLLENSEVIMDVLISSANEIFNPDLLETFSNALFLGQVSIDSVETLICNNHQKILQKFSEFNDHSTWQHIKLFIDCLKVLYTWIPMTSERLRTFYGSLFFTTIITNDLVTDTLFKFDSSHEIFSRITSSCISCFQAIVDRKDLSVSHMTSHLVVIFRLVDFQLKFTSPVSFQTNPAVVGNVRLVLEVLNDLMTNLIILTSSHHPEAFSSFNFLKTFREFTFTICLTNLESYYEALRIWSTHLDFIKIYFFGESQLTATIQELTQKLPNDVAQISALIAESVIDSILFSRSASNLMSLSDAGCLEIEDPLAKQSLSIYLAGQDHSSDLTVDSVKEDDYIRSMSPYRRFFHENMLVLDNATFLAPQTTFERLVCIFQQTFDQFDSIIQQIISIDQNPALKSQLHITLRDFATIIQAVGFLIYPLTSYAMTDRPQGAQFLPWFVNVLSEIYKNYDTIFNEENNKNLNDQLIFEDCVEIFSQILSTLHCLVSRGHIALDVKFRNNFDTQDQTELAAFIVMENSSDYFIKIFKPLENLTTKRNIPPPRITHWLTRLLEATHFRMIPSPSEHFVGETLYIIQFIMEILRKGGNHDWFPVITRRVLVKYLIHFAFGPAVRSQDECKKMLSTLFVFLFGESLSEESMQTRKKDHLICLFLLTESLIAVELYKAPQRNFLFSILVETSILDRLMDRFIEVNTMVSVFSIKGENLDLCLAYMAFFTTLTRVFAYSKKYMDFMPPLIGRILASFQGGCRTNLPSEHVIETILDILFLIAQNRYTLTKIWRETIQLSLGTLLIAIANCPEVNFDVTETTMIHLVCQASIENPHACRRLIRLIAFIFKNATLNYLNNTSQTHEVDSYWSRAIFLVLISTLNPKQTDSQLVDVFLESLHGLQAMRHFLDHEYFSREWRDLISCRIMDLLIARSQPSCTEALISALYLLTITTGRKEDSFSSKLFIEEFLPKYLSQDWIKLDDCQRETLINQCPFLVNSKENFASSNCNSNSNLLNISNVMEISKKSNYFIDKDHFQISITKLITDLNFYQSLHV